MAAIISCLLGGSVFTSRWFRPLECPLQSACRTDFLISFTGKQPTLCVLDRGFTPASIAASPLLSHSAWLESSSKYARLSVLIILLTILSVISLLLIGFYSSKYFSAPLLRMIELPHGVGYHLY